MEMFILVILNLLDGGGDGSIGGHTCPTLPKGRHNPLNIHPWRTSSSSKAVTTLSHRSIRSLSSKRKTYKMSSGPSSTNPTLHHSTHANPFALPRPKKVNSMANHTTRFWRASRSRDFSWASMSSWVSLLP